jgi:hypothetical protein
MTPYLPSILTQALPSGVKGLAAWNMGCTSHVPSGAA